MRKAAIIIHRVMRGVTMPAGVMHMAQSGCFNGYGVRRRGLAAVRRTVIINLICLKPESRRLAMLARRGPAAKSKTMSHVSSSIINGSSKPEETKNNERKSSENTGVKIKKASAAAKQRHGGVMAEAASCSS
jgi:hypothetical protein